MWPGPQVYAEAAQVAGPLTCRGCLQAVARRLRGSLGPPRRPGHAHARLLSAVDPLFEVNTRRYPTRGQPCGAGESAISVDGDGTVRRCHFIARPLGNLYAGPVEDLLAPRPCTRASCECHIGYVHLPRLDAAEVYGPGLLARIPEGPGWAEPRGYLERAAQLLAR